MALIFMDGFDADDLALKWTQKDVVYTTTTPTRFNTGRAIVQANYFWFLKKILPVAATKLFVGFAHRVDAGAPGRVIMSLWSNSGQTGHIYLSTASDVAFRIVRFDGTILATAANGTHTANVWEYVEIMATLADTGGRVVVRVNGVTVIDYTGDTRNSGSDTTFDTIQIGSNGGNNGAFGTYIDDLYVLDDTGSTNNDFLGDVRIQTLVPTGPGTDTQLTPTGVAANWDNVNELPYSAADYNGSSTVGQRDTYAMQDVIGTTGTVFAVQPNFIVAKTDAGAANLKPVIRSGGTVYYGPTVAPSSSQTIISVPKDTNPATSSAWTASTVNALETGIEVA